MKILYVASNPSDASALMLEAEITTLQRQFIATTGDPVEFIAMPKLSVEDLAKELRQLQPDILHFSAHAEENHLALATSSGRRVAVTATMLRAFLQMYPPKLIYLNACNSESLASELVDVVPVAIGTTAPITNRGACAAAAVFYDYIINGASVQQAFEASNNTLSAIEQKEAESKIHTAQGVDTATLRLHHTPRIVAQFDEEDYNPDSDDDHYTLKTGILGCPRNTTQVVIFTDDESFLPDKENDELAKYADAYPESHQAYHLARIVRSTAVRNVLWAEEPIRTTGDHRLYAAGVTASGDIFAIAGTLCGAIKDYFRFLHPTGKVPLKAEAAIKQLTALDGSLPVSIPPPRRRKKVRR